MTCPIDGQPLQEDLTFRVQLAAYGVPRTRYSCTAGHTVYEDYGPLRELRQEARCCSQCGEPVSTGRKCDGCRAIRPLVVDPLVDRWPSMERDQRRCQTCGAPFTRDSPNVKNCRLHRQCTWCHRVGCHSARCPKA